MVIWIWRYLPVATVVGLVFGAVMLGAALTSVMFLGLVAVFEGVEKLIGFWF